MTSHRVVVLGAGAAGTSAVRTLQGHDGIDVTLVARTGETPYNRMLVKGVAYGQLSPDMVSVRLPDTTLLRDTVLSVDTTAHRVHLASGTVLPFDSLVVATGSVPRTLDDLVKGARHATHEGRVTTLHSLDDAVRVRDALAALGRPGRVVCYGGGITVAETASALSRDGHQVTLVARSATPGVAAFGADVADVIAGDHRAHLAATHFGRTITRVHARAESVDVRLDDGTWLEGDLLIVALGTTPAGPAPWEGAVPVDDRLRTGEPGVYAAGGVASHHDDLGTWRIDHWDDGVAQGAHAARMVLCDVGAATDPGPYRPRSPFMAAVHGKAIAGAGLTHHTVARRARAEELLVLHLQRDTVVGVSAVDAIASVYAWGPRLHEASA